MQRRGFLKALLAMPAVAMAAKLGVDKSMAGEIRLELERDLARPDRLYIQMPGEQQIMLPQGKVWASVSQVSGLWAGEIMRLYGEEVVSAARAAQMGEQMARALNFDLEMAQVPADKLVIVGKPMIAPVETKSVYGYTKPKAAVKLVAGLKSEATIFGTEWTVGYVPPAEGPSIITPG